MASINEMSNSKHSKPAQKPLKISKTTANSVQLFSEENYYHFQSAQISFTVSAAFIFDIDAALETSYERLASGKRINSSSDDAAGLAIAGLHRVSGTNQATATLTTVFPWCRSWKVRTTR